MRERNPEGICGAKTFSGASATTLVGDLHAVPVTSAASGSFAAVRLRMTTQWTRSQNLLFPICNLQFLLSSQTSQIPRQSWLVLTSAQTARQASLAVFCAVNQAQPRLTRVSEHGVRKVQ